MIKKPIVTVIGGGTGTQPVLSGLKNFPNIDLRVIVSMTDDGGSNKFVRDKYDVLPLSDLRKSILALSNTKNLLLKALFEYRFPKGYGLRGHTLGNLIMLALTEITSSEYHAITILEKNFKVRGKVIPVTFTKSMLCAEYSDGKTVRGESKISDSKYEKSIKINNIYLYPQAEANEAAIRSIQQSDFIIIGPGDLYSSLISNLIVNGIKESFQTTNAQIIMIANLMTKKGETRGMQVSDLIKEIEKYLDKKVDRVIINTEPVDECILKKYRKVGEKIIKDDLEKSSEYLVTRAKLISNVEFVKDKCDELERSILKHDEIKLAKVLMKIINKR